MASTSETGHDIDIANSKSYVSVTETMGAEYQPTEPAHELAVVKPQVAAAAVAQTAVNEAKKPCKTATDKRVNLFKGVKGLSTVVNGVVGTLLIPQNTKDGITSIHKKIQGTKIGKDVQPEEGKEAPKTNSVSQQSFVSIAKNLRDMIGSLKEIPKYAPKEEQRKITSLEAFVTELETINEEMPTLETNLANARSKRDALFYKDDEGLVDTMKSIKGYLKTLNGGKHPAYKKVVTYKFTTKPKKK